MTTVCYSLRADPDFSLALATSLGAAHVDLECHHFPDGETRLRLGAPCSGRDVILVAGDRDPNAGALPLYFAAQAAKDLGAASVGLLAPYLPYMRQDARFHEGEAVSAVAYARFLSSCVDWVAAVDPHLHRIRSLDEIFTIPARCISAVPAIAAWIAGNVSKPVVIGPDEESRQWVAAVAATLSAPYTVLTKNRSGDRDVAVSLPDADMLVGRTPVIVDDIASSGRTLAEAASALRSLGSPPVTCVVVHALLSDADHAALHVSGVERLVSTNTIRHGTNAIDLIPSLAGPVRMLCEAHSRSAS